jgi:hypothetical protein
MAKIINLIVSGDYEALSFEETFGANPPLEIWEKIKKTGKWMDSEGNEYEAKATEIDISAESFDLMISKIDYDQQKHDRPFLVNE